MSLNLIIEKPEEESSISKPIGLILGDKASLISEFSYTDT